MQLLARALFALILCAAVPAAAASAGPTDWGRLDDAATGRAVPGPAGWLNWCLVRMARCAPDGPERPLAATPQLMALLAAVQTEVNRAITPEPEPVGRDLWQVASVSGDCEDYALAKRQRLLAAGLPRGALRLATAKLPTGELHAVLAVDTDRGTLVLDNLHPEILPLRQLGYQWLSAQGSDETLLWRELAAGQTWPRPTSSLTGGAVGDPGPATRIGAAAQ